MNSDNKKPNWLPFFSIVSLFFVLGVVGWLFGVSGMPVTIGLAIMATATVIFGFLPPEFNFNNYWYTSIKSEAHVIIIILALISSILVALFIIPKYEFNLSIKKRV